MVIDINRVLDYTLELDVLFVEDDQELLERSARIFRRFFKNVETAVDGEEGLQKYRSSLEAGTPYDLVITDINMPRMDGLEMSRQIIEAVFDQPIIIISAHNDTEYLHQAIHLGISGYLSKPIDNNQLFRQFYTVCKAIMDKKRYEKYVKQIEVQNRVLWENAHMKKVDSLQEEFLRNISHEINTPLNAVIGFAGILRKYIDTSDPKVVKYLQTLEENANMINVLFHRMMQLSKLRSGTYEFSETGHMLHSVISGMIEGEYRRRAELAGITLHCDVDIGQDVLVTCELALLKTMIGELIDNAIKFTDEGGHITVQLDYDEVTKFLNLDVKDDGIGIEPDEQAKVFDMFYQVDGSLTRKKEGSGIGLSLVKSIVDQNGGSITLESEQGKGSLFHITMPLGEPLP